MELKTVPISGLLGYNFKIPAYQRGYRWDDQQVTDLLDDLLEFSKSEKIGASYYCLQPIVVKANEDGTYDVIDGQQRLTTIFILLSYLYPVRRILHKSTCNRIFTIKFDKRDDCYLNDKKFETDTEEYKNDINKFFIFKAYQTIGKWFESNPDGDYESTILYALLGKTGNESTGVAKVIWYDVSESSDSSIEIFTRLNYGQIPLTDAELIKALLLICDHYPDNIREVRKEVAMRMSSQWDEMENTLNNPFIWSMISSSEHNTESRIDLLINKVVRDIKRQSDKEQKEKMKEEQKDNFVSLYDFSEDKENFDYHIANRYLEINRRTATAVDAFWQKVQDAFTVVRNWASDRTVYHYIGYLTYLAEWKEKDKRKKAKAVNRFIDRCFEKYLDPKVTKSDFVQYLRGLIGEEIKVESLGGLSYENQGNKPMIKILLLFSVQQAIRHSSERLLYPFLLQKQQNITSLEHIHPQNLDTNFENKLDDFNKIVYPWLLSKQRYLEGEDYDTCKRYQHFEVFSKNFFEAKEFIERIDKHFKDLTHLTEEEMHTLRNMALVSKEVNSALSNNFMAEKRDILGQRERGGDYIPLATWMAFNKSFTKTPDSLKFWEKEDREAYYNAIRSMYLGFITKDDEVNFSKSPLAVIQNPDGKKEYTEFARVTFNNGTKAFIDSDCKVMPSENGWLNIARKNKEGKWEYNHMNINGELKSQEWNTEKEKQS